MCSDMGREVTGVRVDNIKSINAKVKAKVSEDSEKEANSIELKDCEVKECTFAEISSEKQQVLGTKIPNFETEIIKIEDQKLNSDKNPSGKLKMKNTTQKSCDVTVDSHVWESPKAVKTPISPNPCNSKCPSSTQKSQVDFIFVFMFDFLNSEVFDLLLKFCGVSTRVYNIVWPSIISLLVELVF